MSHNVYLYIGLMALSTYLIRVLPLTLIRGEIKNPFIRSFLYYVPYVTLAAMTFPAMIFATGTPWSGLAALLVAGFLALRGTGLTTVAAGACGTVFLLELFLC